MALGDHDPEPQPFDLLPVSLGIIYAALTLNFNVEQGLTCAYPQHYGREESNRFFQSVLVSSQDIVLTATILYYFR